MTGPSDDNSVLRRRAHRIRHNFRSRLRNYFLAGVLVTAPLTITVWLAFQIVQFFDSTVRNLIPKGYNPELHLPFSIPGIGLLISLIGITLIGALTAGLIGRFVMRTAEGLVNSMPVVRTIYNALKQIFETVLKTKTDAFRHVVLIEYPRRGIWCLGFLSGETEGEVQNLTDEDMLNVFLPTTPNPTSGFLLFLPKRDVVVLKMTVEEGIKMVVSGGLVTPEDPRSAAERATPQVHVQTSLDRVMTDEAFSADSRQHTTKT
jgi:uncharacterized membrane protein